MATYLLPKLTMILMKLLYYANSNASFVDPCGFYDYGDYAAFDTDLSKFGTPINVTIPVAPLPLLPVADNCTANENCTTLNPNASIASGNSLFLVIDPKSLQVVLQVATPCNKTDNSTVAEKGAIGKVPGVQAGSDGSGLVCNLLTLIQKLVDSILEAILSLLKSLIEVIVNLLSSILQTVLGQLLPTLVNDLGACLTKFLTEIIECVENLVNTTVGGFLAADLLAKCDLSLVSPGLLGDVTKLVNSTLITLLDDVETLVKNLLAPTPEGLIPTLTTEITALVNNTVQDLLKDVDVLVEDLLTELLSNSSVVGNLTEDVTKLLNDVLGDTICNVEKLLNDSDSLSKLILNLEKLIQDLLDDILQDVDKLLVDALTSVLGKKGLLDKLLQDVLKLLQDLLTNLIGSKLNSTALSSNPDKYLTDLLSSLTKGLQEILGNPAPSTGLSVPVAELPVSPLTGIVDAVKVVLTEVITAVQSLLAGLDKLLANGGNGLLSTLLKTIEKLLDDLLKNLLGGVSELLGGKLKSSTGLVDPSTLTSSLGTIVTGILKQVLLCNGTCNGNGNGNTGSNTTNCTVVLPIFYPPPLYPRPCSEDSLFDNANDPRTFLLGLQQFQAYINRNLNQQIDNDCGDELLDSLISGADCYEGRRNLYPFNFDSLPNRLLNGLEGTLRLTNNAATSGLLNLAEKTSNSAT